jgi:hypothetical protein
VRKSVLDDDALHAALRQHFGLEVERGELHVP